MLPNFSQLFFCALAGLLTTLSPCVLPILPFILAGALQENILSPLYLSGGLIISFVTIGWSLAAFGSLLGLEGDSIRTLAGIGLVCAGFVLLIPFLQLKVSTLLASFANQADGALQRNKQKGVLGSLITGILLGAVWSPCNGPTLGTAIALASTEGGGIKSGVMMLSFAIGAVTPLLAMSYGTQGFIQNNRIKIMNTVVASKKIFGVMMILVGFLICTGSDKKIESYLVEHMPNAWVELTSKF